MTSDEAVGAITAGDPNPWRNRLSFGLGTLGRDMTSALVSMYLMYYLTVVLHIGEDLIVGVTVVLVSLRIFDAFSDPVMGVIVDNTHSRWGKHKPWIALGMVLSSIATVLLFVDTGLQGGAFLTVFALLYLFWSLSYTVNDISFYGMLPSLSRDQKERERIGVVARITANIGLFAVVVGFLPLTNALGARLGSLQLGWLAFAAIVAVTMVAFQCLTLLFTKERVITPRQQTPLRELVKVIGHNDQLLWVTAAMLLFMSGYMGTTSLGIFYFRFIFGDESMYPVFAAILGVAQLSGLAVFPLLSRYLRRRQIHLLATVLCLAGLVVFALAGSSMVAVAVAGVLLFVGQAFIQLLMLMFIADCVEYGQWKLGRRNESVTISLQPFIYKSSNAIGNGLVGLALVWSGIAGATSSADVSAGGAIAFKVVMMGIPLVLFVVSWMILRAKYRIDEDFYSRIVAELSAKGA